MSSKPSTRKTFPDFFYSNDALPMKVLPINYKNATYYMLSVTKNNTGDEISTTNYYLPPYEDNDDGMIDCLDVEDSYEIVQTKSGNFMTSFYVPGPLQAVIIGPRGSRLRSLEDRTGTRIKVPRINEKGNVKITGNNERIVASARNQVSLIVLDKREKMPFTHFVSIPVTSSEIQNSFQKFQDEILNGPPTRGINKSVFQNPKKLHLTLTTLTLLDNIEIEEAKQALKSCYQDVVSKVFTKGGKYVINVQGVEIMNDDPSDVHVLYGKVSMASCEKFQQVVDDIVNYFHRKGLIKKQYDHVKLHVTLMNSLFNRENEANAPDVRRNRESFDCTDILKTYENFNFGKTVFEAIYLSIRFTSGADGFYESAYVVTL